MLTSRRTFIGATSAAAGAAAFPMLAPLTASGEPAPPPADGSVVVVAPESWADLAESVAQKLRDTGHTATVALPDEEGFSNGWQGERILLGYLGNNDHVARVYGLYASMVDSIAPGPDGWSLMSVRAPFGGEGDTLIVGAGTRAGAEAGVEKLLPHIVEGALPRVFEAELAPESQAMLPNEGVIDAEYEQSALADIDARIANLKPTMGVEADAVALHTLLSGVAVNSKYFCVLPSPVFANVYRKAMLGYTEFVLADLEVSADQLANSRNMWTNGWNLIGGWRVMETTDLFSDEEKEQINEALIHTYRVNAKDPYLASAPDEGPRWNHEIFPARSLAAAGLYFEAHGGIPEAVEWRDVAARIFDGNTSPVSLDEGSDYLMHLPMAIIDYGMLTGRRAFLATSVRPSADLHSLMIDNLGTMCGGGDTYPHGYSGPFTWGHSQVMYVASWFYRDPIYRHLLQLNLDSPLDQRRSDLDVPWHRFMVTAEDEPEFDPSQYPQVSAQPMDSGLYEDTLEKEGSPVAFEDAFHKLTFRSGFELDDRWLVLDGFGAGRHGHQDTNVILAYHAEGRLFVIERDYIETAPESQSGVIVAKDGVQEQRGPLAHMEWTCEGGGFAISRTVLPDTNGVDWTRTIVTTDGTFHLVLDDLDVLDDGEFFIKNLWQTLGTPELADRSFTVTQEGKAMAIRSLDESSLRAHDRYGHFQKYFKSTIPYPYADCETVLTQAMPTQDLSSGDSVRFANLLTAGDPSNLSDAERIAADKFLITTPDAKWVAVRGALDTPTLRGDGKFHLVGDNGAMLLGGVTNLKAGGQKINFDEPVLVTVQGNEWTAWPLTRDRARYDDNGEPVRPGPIDSGTLRWQPAQRDVAWRHLTRSGQVTTPLENPAVNTDGWSQLAATQGEVCAVAAATGMTLLGTTEGQITAVDEEGAVAWEASVNARINEIAVHVIDDEEWIMISDEAWHVTALTATGSQRWQITIPNDAKRREQKGNLIGVTNVRVSYSDGANQPPMFRVGTQFRWLYTLDLEGNQLDEEMLHWYGIEDHLWADMDGDGKDEGAFALEYYYLTFHKEGAIRGGIIGGPGYRQVRLLPQGDERPLVVHGTKQGEVHAMRFGGTDNKGEEVWGQRLSGDVLALETGTFHDSVGGEVLAGTACFDVVALKADGTRRFTTNVDDRVLHLAGTTTGYLAGLDNGNVVALDVDGAVTDRWRFDDLVIGLQGGDKPQVTLRDGSVHVLG